MKTKHEKTPAKATARDLKPRKNPKGGETLPIEEVSFNYGKMSVGGIDKSSPKLAG
jgi:hypothetical protein